MSYLPLSPTIRNLTNPLQVKGGLAFDGVTSTALVVHNIGYNIGTNDHSVSVTMLVPSSVSAAQGIFALSSSSTTFNAARGFYAQISASGNLEIVLIGATTNDDLYKRFSGFISTYGGKLVTITAVRSVSGATLTVYINGSVATVTEGTDGTFPAWSDTVTSTYLLLGSIATSRISSATIYSAQLFNRALNASEVVDLANKGVGEADKWASLTAKYTSDFSAGVDGATASAGAVTGNIDSIGGENDWLRFTIDSVTGLHRATINSSATVVTGKRYRLTIKYYIPSTNSNMTYFSTWYGAGNVKLADQTTTDVATTYTTEFTATASGDIRMYANGGGSVTDPGGDDVFYLKSIVLTQIGCLIDPDLASADPATGNLVMDRSSNGYTGVVSQTGVSQVLRKSIQIYGDQTTANIVNNTAVSARAMRGGLAFDGVTVASDLHTPGVTIGTSDFAVRLQFLCPTAYSNFPTLLVASSTGSYTAAGALWLLFDSNAGGDLSFNLNNTDNNNRAIYKITNFGSAFGGKIVDVVFVRSSGGTVTVYANGVVQTLTSANTGTPASWSDSVSAAYVRLGASSATQNLFNSTIYSAQLFNRALTQAQVIDLMSKGVDEADKWANLTALYTSSFTSGTDSWAVTGASAVTRDAGPTGGQTDNLKIATTVANNAFASTRTMATSMVAGKRYRLTYSYYMDVAGNTAAKYFGVWTGAGNQNLEHVTPVDKTWTTRTVEFTQNTTTAQFAFYLESIPGTTVFNSTNTTDAVYLRGITITQIGNLLDPDLSVGVGYQAPDRSSNKYHGVISSSGVSHVIDQRRGQLRVSSNTNGNQQLLGSQVCLPTNAIITSIIGYTTGTPTIKIGNVSAGSQIVASVAMSASTYQSFTVAATTTTTGNLWVNSTTSDTINWTITYMIADP